MFKGLNKGDELSREFNKRLISLAAPIAFQKLMLALVAVADTFMLGSVEQNSMSAVSLATQVQFVQNMIMGSIIAAGSVLAAQYWGKGDRRTVEKIFCILLRCCGLLSLITFVGCIFFPRYLMLIFTNEEVLIEIGAGYLKIAGWSYLMTGISQCYLTVMKVTGHATETARISSVAVVLNIALNAVLIYGLFGLPALEVRGAATATLIARAVELIWSFSVSLRHDHISPVLKDMFRFDRALSRDFSKCCLPLVGAGLFWGIGFTSYTAFMGHLGTDAAAANSVTAVIRDLICCACDGAANGGGIMIGHELGAGNLTRGKIYGDKLLKLSFIIGIISTLIMLALTPLLLNFVKLTPEAKKLFIGMMVVMAFYMIGRAVNTIVINGIFAAGGDTMFDMYSLAVTMWGIAVPLAFLGTFVLGWHPVIVYACTCLDEVGKIPWVLLHYRKYKWVRDLTRIDD